MNFSQRIKSIRLESGMNQTDFAKSIDCNQSKYNKWENGINVPDYDTLCKLSKKLNKTTDFLLGLSIDENEDEKVKRKEYLFELTDYIEGLPLADKNRIYKLLKRVTDNYLMLGELDNIRTEYLEHITGLMINIEFSIERFTRKPPIDEIKRILYLYETAGCEKSSRRNIEKLFTSFTDAIKEVPLHQKDGDENATEEKRT